MFSNNNVKVKPSENKKDQKPNRCNETNEQGINYQPIIDRSNTSNTSNTSNRLIIDDNIHVLGNSLSKQNKKEKSISYKELGSLDLEERNDEKTNNNNNNPNREIPNTNVNNNVTAETEKKQITKVRSNDDRSIDFIKKDDDDDDDDDDKHTSITQKEINVYQLTFTIDNAINLNIEEDFLPYFLVGYNLIIKSITSKYSCVIQYNNTM